MVEHCLDVTRVPSSSLGASTSLIKFNFKNMGEKSRPASEEPEETP